jgi:integrase
VPIVCQTLGMAGQIIPRGKNTWLLRVFLGRDPQTGRRQYYNETFYGGKKEAGDALIDALRDRKQGKLGAARTTVGELLDGLHRDYKVNGKSHEWVDGVVRKHLRPYFGSMRASKLRFGILQRYVEQRQVAGATNATINREVALLRRAFNLAHESLPALPSKLKENNVRKGFFEHEDYAALLKTLPDELRPVLTFAYYTGCRKGEILGLQWSQVDLLEQVVRLEAGTTKNDEPRIIPLAPELYEVLRFQKSIRDQKCHECPWVFSRDGEEILDFRGGWEEACKAAKLWDAQAKKPTKLFHDLRRTGVRNLVRAGVPESVAMRISGHKTRSIFERYNIVTETDLKSAAQRLGQYIQEKAKASEAKPKPITKRAVRVQ